VTGVRQVVIDAPERRNALSRRVLDSLRSQLTTLGGDVTGVVISGRGTAFSAGADFGDLTGTSVDVEYDDAVAEVTRIIRELPIAVVAALEGPCIGAGADLALSCDVRIAAEGSYLQVPAVRLGLLYNPETIDRLRRAFPRDSVRRLLILGERFDAATAREAGFVSTVVPAGEAVRHATELLSLTTPDQLAAVAATKGLLDAQEGEDYDPAVWEQRRRALLDSPDRQAAIDQAKRVHHEKES
jgi:enoyl-CoA hydratase/carnithine racemase